jgi:hypothetical protein
MLRAAAAPRLAVSVRRARCLLTRGVAAGGGDRGLPDAVAEVAGEPATVRRRLPPAGGTVTTSAVGEGSLISAILDSVPWPAAVQIADLDMPFQTGW